MEYYLAELYDYTYGVPFLIGVYTTEDGAQTAIDIIIKQLKEKGTQDYLEGRFVPIISTIILNGFTEYAMDLLSDEAFFA